MKQTEQDKIAQAKYRKTDKAKESRKRHMQTHKGKCTRMYYEAKRRAKENGLEWDFELCELMIPATCPAINIPLFFTNGKTTDNTPTLDRVDNSKGYTRDNVQIISYRANRIKNNASLDELVSITMYVAQHYSANKNRVSVESNDEMQG